MDNSSPVAPQGIEAALSFARNRDIALARQALLVPDEINDALLLDALITLNTGLELFGRQKQVQSLEYFQKALPVAEKFGDEDARFLVLTLTRFAEGLSALFNGDAHEAAQLLSIESATLERMSFFDPQFKIVALSYKATSLVALARTHLNAADFTTAEKVFGEARSVHDNMLGLLDPANSDHSIAFAEIYGTRVECTFLFICAIDIPSLDLNMWRKRLDMSSDDVKMLEKYLGTTPEGDVRTLVSQYSVIFSAFEKLHGFLETAIVTRRPFKKDEVTDLIGIDSELLRSRQILQAIGQRGQGLLFTVDMLRRLQQNTLQIAKAATKDFGRFGGVISLVAFVVIIVVMHFTVRPSEYNGVFYYLGALILALIVGFGFGALKFQPLLRIFSNAIDKGLKGEA